MLFCVYIESKSNRRIWWHGNEANSDIYRAYALSIICDAAESSSLLLTRLIGIESLLRDVAVANSGIANNLWARKTDIRWCTYSEIILVMAWKTFWLSYIPLWYSHTAQVSSSFLTLSDSTDANTIMVECSQSGSIGSGRSFKCEFCYNFGRSCQSSLTCMDVIPGSGSATLLPSSLAEGTYCYRATAIVDGIPARMIQDTFSIRSPCSNTGII